MAKKVLLIDDDTGLLDAMTFTLRREGWVVATATDAASAIAQFCRHTASPFDLMITNVQLPDMDGVTLIDWIRAQGIGTPVVAMTAHRCSAVRKSLRRRGVSEILDKPFGATALASSVRRCLDNEQGGCTMPADRNGE